MSPNTVSHSAKAELRNGGGVMVDSWKASVVYLPSATKFFAVICHVIMQYPAGVLFRKVKNIS